MDYRLKVSGDHVKVVDNHLISEFVYYHSEVTEQNGKIAINSLKTPYTFKTDLRVPKLGIMLVGLGGNNGTTFCAGLLSNKLGLTWQTKKGTRKANFYGSLTQASTTKIGVKGIEEIFVPLSDVLPLVKPEDCVLSGWDLSKMNLGDAMVLDWDLQEKLRPHMKNIVPLPGIYYEDFIAMNQKERVDNVLPGKDKNAHLEQIRQDIRNFKKENKLDKVIVLWTANTERYCTLAEGIHDTADNVLKAIKDGRSEISPSTVYAVAAILEGCSFINGSPQNTLVNGVIELAEKQGVFIVGDDFKSGQTKFKTALVEFLVSAGIKPRSIVSYNHLGNNDGLNLSSERQFKSKEISKSSCVDDMLAHNEVLFPKDEDRDIDHTIVIKYVPTAGDTKKAMDEYVSEIFLGGNHTLTLYNVCEDSLLAAPLILDLILVTEIFERIEWKNPQIEKFSRFHNVLSTLGYLCKAPLTAIDCPLVNALSRQRACIENIFKACAGIHLNDDMLLEFRCNPRTTTIN